MLLVLDDEDYVEDLVKRAFPDEEIVTTRTSKQLLRKLNESSGVKAVIVDQYIERGAYPESEFLSDYPEYEGFLVALEVKKLREDIPVLLLTRFADSSVFMRAFQMGIIPIEFVDKELTARTIREKILRVDPEAIRQLVKEYRKLGWIAESPQSRELIWEIEQRYKDSDEPLLITGEIGVGKSLLARIIHKRSKRANRPLLTFVISAYPKENLYYMLFGVASRSFTGVEGRPGLVEKVGEGTLILDEIGDLSTDVQLHLHTLLEERKFKRMQETRERTFKGRVILLTHKNLKKLVRNGLFREDLFSRISGLRLHIPPLRERREDIKALFEFYCPGLEFTSNALDFLVNEYQYPANVRSLRKIAHILMLESKGNVVTLDMAVRAISDYEEDKFTVSVGGYVPEMVFDWMLANGKTFSELKDDIFKIGLKKLGKKWNQQWERLGFTKATFYRLLKSIEE